MFLGHSAIEIFSVQKPRVNGHFCGVSLYFQVRHTWDKNHRSLYSCVFIIYVYVDHSFSGSSQCPHRVRTFLQHYACDHNGDTTWMSLLHSPIFFHRESLSYTNTSQCRHHKRVQQSRRMRIQQKRLSPIGACFCYERHENSRAVCSACFDSSSSSSSLPHIINLSRTVSFLNFPSF